MTPKPGIRPPDPKDLLRVRDRLTFLYVEKCVVHRDSNAITVTDARGVAHIPAAALSVLMMGPGVRITHSAVSLLAESGSTAIWVGENGVRYYAHGAPPSRSSRLLEAQARLVSDPASRLSVARRMYLMRFEGESVDRLSMQQLRGREGARVRRLYRENSRRTGVEWGGREYDSDDFDSGSVVNRCLSAANSALYGVVHAVIVALGCSPGLGFVHSGTYRSFVYDIADLYKADLSIPVAFDVAAEELETGVGEESRRRMRDAIRQSQVLERAVRDIKSLLSEGEDLDGWDDLEVDDLRLWDEVQGFVPSGISYVER
ncbi:MAG: type I-E CRISPR-associated endonuclease Cas1e [Schaalia hyovaginalis]|uniref:type I-E CRISPR-associated endonuclease Cas1e n=1 Tax=Schaalia hyovaginalis TaxID=29316 RepID=UPI001F253F75|nr:type I-E CRISPR-associated endonuclease Cas1e [Schaalia hyovaginalis]MCF2711064.1 type I-E CRISPR-associated endonuclease Cas1 [Schaalia hyovaginalis]MDY3093244.1 type I-E CRISPR-associated endonuclease Cas1e [Schaalia hyovaginalis]